MLKKGDKVKVVPGLEDRRHENKLETGKVYIVAENASRHTGTDRYYVVLAGIGGVYVDRLVLAKPKKRYRDWIHA